MAFFGGGASVDLASPPAIGNTTPNTGKFTTLEATTSLQVSTSGFLFGGTNLLEQRNSTSAQTFRLYNTFTDASNYERGFFRWASNVLEIGAEAAGTGTARNLRLYGNVGIGTSSPASPLSIEPSTNPTFGWLMKMLLSGLTANNSVGYVLGRDASNYNLASIDFNYVGNNSTSNRISYGFWGVATPPINILASGFVGIGTISPSTTFDINADKFRVRTAKTPASASAAGDQGDICWDSSYIYICTATNTWKRVAIATWP